MKKKGPMIAVILLIISLMLFGFLSYTFFYNLKNPNASISRNEFSDKLTKMGETIYKDYYYEITKVDKTDEELKEYLKMFNKVGLSFNLVELSKYSDENKEIIDGFLNSNSKCNKENTRVIIYPKEPYSKVDYTVETQIDCSQKK